jgi:hypothetical protein
MGRYLLLHFVWFVASLSAFLAVFSATAAGQDVTVTIDLMAPDIVSSFEIGVTHTQWWEWGDSTAVANAKSLLVNGGVRYQNQHIMGWVVENPEPSPGVYEWGDLDGRIDLILSMANTIPVITFCTAPGWMKTSGENWNMNDRVADDHVDDFADLCATIAQRYPDVIYFQVWNEMKGYWSSSLDNWDYVRYTTLYNAVYDAVKAVRPDAQLGGPYLCIRGDGAITIGRSGTNTHCPIDSRDWDVFDYWMANKHGADFICFDRWLIDWHDDNYYTEAEEMLLTHFFGDVVGQLRAETNLPIWISEFYGGMDGDLDFIAANHASCYYHCLINDANLALVWNPQEGEIAHYLFTDTDPSSGGQPTPHYYVVKAFNDYFGPGTQIYETMSSSPDVEALTSLAKTMLINKSPTSVTVGVNADSVVLDGYEVKVIDTQDEIIDFKDFAVLAYYWADYLCSAPDWCAGYDSDHSGYVDFNDLKYFAEDWVLPPD